jgi:DNA polymerase V
MRTGHGNQAINQADDQAASKPTSGFPSPAEDYIESPLDVRDVLMRHPTATFFLRVDGAAMRDTGIHAGDILVVDRALDPVPGAIVVAAAGGELLVRRLGARWGGTVTLVAAHPDEPAITITQRGEPVVWGVVTWVLHPC